jgi:hypothetical protein
MAVLTVLLAPHTEAEEILAVLTDYSAVGLLTGFAWVDSGDAGASSLPATVVTDGRANPVVLQQIVTARRFERLRLAVLVPVESSPASRVPLAVEQRVEQILRFGAMGAPITLLRLLYTHGAAAAVTADPSAVLEGWHNLLIAPEDSAGPGLGSVTLDRLTDPLDVARHVAPVVAGAAGLWADIESTPLDSLGILPGLTIRAVRAFYRQLDTTAVEEQLRAQLFDPNGRLPLPRGGTVPIVYVDDVPTATRAMAEGLWRKHRDVLRGPRVAVETGEIQQISIWAALKMFLSFLGAALRRAPSKWVTAVVGSVSSVVATTVQNMVFGRADSAFAVVTSAEPASWEDLGRSADELGAALDAGGGAAVRGAGRGEHLAHQDLSPLWADFVNAALTLADGGRRAAGLEPVRVGAAVGVVRNCPDVVPSAADRFSAIPASLAAVIGVSTVEAPDVMGAAGLRDRLSRTYGDPAAGVEARRAAADLDTWRAHAAKSYAWQSGLILANFLDRARSEVAGLVQEIRDKANRDAVDERLRRRQRTIGLILKTFGWTLFAALALLAFMAAFHWVSWKFALITGAVLFGLYLVIALGLFLLAQRDLFAEINLRQSQQSQLDAMHANLRTALQDLSRLSSAYGQLLAWCRVLGAMLRAPFGPAPPRLPAPGQLTDGLPLSTQLGVATANRNDADTAIHGIEQLLYPVGWLTGPWDDLLAATATELREDPSALLVMPGAGTGSALDQWSHAAASGQLHATGADALWRHVQRMFANPQSPAADALTGAVFVPATGRTVSAAEFSAGVIESRRDRAAPFDAWLFTDAALTAGRSAVVVDEPVVVRRGVGYRAAVVHVGDGLPPYDFALFTPRTSVAATRETGSREAAGAADLDEPPGPPGAGKLVF